MKIYGLPGGLKFKIERDDTNEDIEMARKIIEASFNGLLFTIAMAKDKTMRKRNIRIEFIEDEPILVFEISDLSELSEVREEMKFLGIPDYEAFIEKTRAILGDKERRQEFEEYGDYFIVPIA